MKWIIEIIASVIDQRHQNFHSEDIKVTNKQTNKKPATTKNRFNSKYIQFHTSFSHVNGFIHFIVLWKQSVVDFVTEYIFIFLVILNTVVGRLLEHEI